MSLVYCSIRTASCQQNSPKYADFFYQRDSARSLPTGGITFSLRIRSGIRVFHLIAEFKEHLVQRRTRLFFQHFGDLIVCFFF